MKSKIFFILACISSVSSILSMQQPQIDFSKMSIVQQIAHLDTVSRQSTNIEEITLVFERIKLAQAQIQATTPRPANFANLNNQLDQILFQAFSTYQYLKEKPATPEPGYEELQTERANYVFDEYDSEAEAEERQQEEDDAQSLAEFLVNHIINDNTF